ncbi:MAG TPA: hypothetical protein VHW45_19935 [Candidatus Sulfotelmatobacter sp.]|jgi:hypothetical protein|nr:hypothetical protein [Candidatus Sulfotelmatobacter sp.]
MLRVLGAFLLVFWLLSIIVRMDAMAEVFAMVALACFTADLAFDSHHQHRHARHHTRGVASLEGEGRF